MSRLTQYPAVGSIDLFQNPAETSSTAPFSQSISYVGQRFESSDGREFVFVKVGASALTQGTLIQSSAIVAGHQGLATVAAEAVGSKTVTVTLGGTAATSNQYSGGFLVVQAGTGLGQTLRVASHPAQTNTGGNLVVTLEDAFTVALNTTSVCSLLANPYQDVIVNPISATGSVVGVAIYPLAASTSTNYSFGLLQTRGIVGVTSDALPATAGEGIAPSTTTAGDITVSTATSSNIGRAIVAGTSTDTKPVFISNL